MRVPLRLATALAASGCVVLTVALAWFVVRAAAARVMFSQGQQHLAAAVVLGAEQLRASRGVALDSVTSTLALATGYRVSVFDADERLVADSNLGSVPADGGSAVRPEVSGALSRMRSSSIRTSTIDGRPYLFSAVRLYRGGEQAVLRLGAPVEPVREAASRLALWAAFAVLAAGTAAVIGLDRGADRMVRVLQDIRILLARIGASEPPGARVRLPRVIELARVASAANRVRGELEDQVGRVTRERDELAQLMDEVGEGLMALTSDARILRINPAARQLLGLTDVIPFSPVGSIVRDPVLRDLLEASVVRRDGRLELQLGDRELEVRTKRGTEGGAVVLIVDITEIKRLEAVRSDFVANASHELKTPLTVIRAAAETVLDESLPGDLRSRFLRSIEDNTVRLQRLVDDLLDLSRYESGAWLPESVSFRLEEVARAAWTELCEKATGRNVDFEILGRGEALGDEAAAYQIFRNLFENSIRYVPEDDARISVRIDSSGSHLAVAVEDNGSGIPASALPRIFERFYRVDAARSRKEGGTGLGLAIVRHLVSSMGGEVEAGSMWGAGTTITFTIPRAA